MAAEFVAVPPKNLCFFNDTVTQILRTAWSFNYPITLLQANTAVVYVCLKKKKAKAKRNQEMPALSSGWSILTTWVNFSFHYGGNVMTLMADFTSALESMKQGSSRREFQHSSLVGPDCQWHIQYGTLLAFPHRTGTPDILYRTNMETDTAMRKMYYL